AARAGGPANNRLDAAGFGGQVTLDGASGDDFLIGGIAADLLTGGSGNDTLDGGWGVDTVAEASDANFTLAFNSLIGPGSDSLISIEQARLTGGISPNSFTVTDWTGNATLDGGSSTDRIVWAGGANLVLTSALLSSSAGSSFSLQGIEEAELTGGFGDNSFDASTFPGAVTLNGGSGNDWLRAGAGDDELSGGLGNDTIDGGAGTDVLVEMAD